MKEDIKVDCFAYNSKANKCECLNKVYCEFEDCKWYKPNTELSFTELKEDTKAYTAKRKSLGLD